MAKYFGTDGIRGKNEKFNETFITEIANAFSKYLLDKTDNPKIIIGGDTRLSTKYILDTLIDCLVNNGIDVYNVSILQTPAISFLTNYYKLDGGIIITASHNPFTDNGIKLLNSIGEKMDDFSINIIEKYIDDKINILTEKKGNVEDYSIDAKNIYKKHLIEVSGCDLSGLNIGVDCANGAASSVASSIFNEFCDNVTLISNNENYSTLINENCGSTHLENIKNLVLNKKLDIGIAFDGDADRCLLVDNLGNVVDGDVILAIISNNLSKKNKLKNNKMAITVMANQGLINYGKDNNIDLTITNVGDAFVYEAMKTKDINLGGEQSGHIILPNQKTGDGLLTALVICSILKEENKSLYELSKIMKQYPQILLNIVASDNQKDAFKTDSIINDIIKKYTKDIENDGGRMLIRPSGTEALIRITIWGDNYNKIELIAKEIGNLLEERLNILGE